MRGAQEELSELGPLLLAGRLDELRSRMLKLWPTDDTWEQDDVGFITMLLLGAKHEHPQEADPLYAVYAERIKGVGNGDLRWLQTLNVRARVVWAYEGSDAAANWLRDTSQRISPPDNGVAHLILAGLLLDEQRAVEALKDLRIALRLSLSGIEWYSLEAINEMVRCQLMLGNQRLTFEYMKAHAIQSYKLGRVSGTDAIKSCKGNAILMGEFDYLIDLQGNVANAARNIGNYSSAAIAESEAALALARIGSIPAACDRFRIAASYAAHGSHPNDPAFSLVCQLLARFIEPTHISDEEMVRLLDTQEDHWLSPAVRHLLQETRECVRDGVTPEIRLLEAWMDACGNGSSESRPPSAEQMMLLVLNHLAALLGRYYEEDENASLFGSDEAVMFYAIVLECGGTRNVITTYVRARLAEHLLKAWKFDEAVAICEPKLDDRQVEIYDRFLFQQLAARCKIHTAPKAAYRHAMAALADWRRILDGLYVEEHKVSWLRQGADCLNCAIQAISKPVEWLPEKRRRRELFRLAELGKARLVSDMINSRGYLPRPYKLFDSSSADSFFLWDEDEQDWNIPLTLQTAIYYDGMSVQVHDETGATLSTGHLDLAPLRCTIMRPVSAEARLLTTAESVAYEAVDMLAAVDLYRDYMSRTRPTHNA